MLEFFFSIGFIAIPLSIIATLIRSGMHAASGFRNFREAKSTATIVGSFIGDICTLILVPLLYVSITWNGPAFNETLVVFTGAQQYFWLAWIMFYTAYYYYALNVPYPLAPWREIIIGVVIGAGVALNGLIAWPLLFEPSVWLSVIGNLPVIIALLLLMNRRHVLLLNNTKDVLDQRRYDNADILDYLPEPGGTAETYAYTGSAGTFLRQPLPAKMLAFTVMGAIIIAVSVLVASASGITFFWFGEQG